MTARRRGGAALALLVAGCAAPGEEGGGRRPPLPRMAERLPAAVAGFERGATTEHESERPGFGIGVGYATPRRTAVATVHIYDRAVPRVPDEPASPEIEAELNRSVEEMLAAAPSRTGRRLAERERVTLAPAGGGPGLRCALLGGAYGRTPVAETVCVGGAAGYFLKAQVTMDARGAPAADASAFVGEVARAARAGT